ncbi:MAG TPA: polysaccharide deacetylase family protein [Rhizomicrobium sp.]|jgi:peptidoglycan/xylan/chitin deacetylase (PgdA/CDA1 family)|nr:polysaccharide deacetylase family protein [Rhizomicrobium sp.]
MRRGSETLRILAQWIPQAAVRPFGRPVALFFHGVAPQIADPRIEINHHTPEAFRAIAVQLKRHFNILPLDALTDALNRPERHARAVFLMSDDGYANTMHAAEVLEELRLPWTLFVSSRHIETGELNPLILARLFVHYAPEGPYDIPRIQQPIALGSADTRGPVAVSVLQRLKRLPAGHAREAIAAMTSAFPAGRLAQLRAIFESERYLTWNEVKALHGRGVEIGAHAHWHWPMNDYQSADDLQLQAKLPRDAIVARIGRCRYFSYPFGNVGDVSNAAWQAVREAGYSHAFTALSGTLGPALNPWLLPRYALRADERHLPALLPMLRMADRRLARLTTGAAPALTVSH